MPTLATALRLKLRLSMATANGGHLLSPPTNEKRGDFYIKVKIDIVDPEAGIWLTLREALSVLCSVTPSFLLQWQGANFLFLD